MPAKKYKLFKNDGSNGDVPQCAFFFSPDGCRNGDKCKFSHKLPSEQNKPSDDTFDDSSAIVSSESEDETPPKQQQQTKKEKIEKKKNTPSTSDKKQNATPNKPNPPKKKITPNKTSNVTPNKKSPNPNESNKKRKRNQNETNNSAVDPELGLFCKPTKRVKETNGKETNTPNSKRVTTPKSSAPKEQKKAEPQVPAFRTLNLPIAGFNTETGEVQHSRPSSPAETEENTLPKEDPKPKYPIPQSTPEGLIWRKAVENTRANPKYESIYDFEKVKSQCEENGVTKRDEWIKARPFGLWCSKNPHAIAIDCEMCETKDPDSGTHDHKALCRLSVVNAVNPSEVLLDTLVKPVWPVVDYRTRINGIKQENLDSVEFTLRHAQAFMMALCSEETVILGHALHNDLAALKMEHHCNVDSALLFKSKDAETPTCSLKDLAKSVTGKEMPNIHCSVNDARTALICLKDGYLDKDCNPEPVEKTIRKPKFAESAELFVHRIPKGCKTDHIKNMFLAHTSIIPEEVPDLSFGATTGKTTVSFTSPGHANLAFATLDGEAKPDKTGRMQKRIYLRNGDYTYVRKMTMERKKSVRRESGAGEQKNQSAE